MEMSKLYSYAKNPSCEKKFKAKMGLEPMTREIVWHTALPLELL